MVKQIPLKKWLKGNLSSNIVSDFSRISVLFPITSFSISSLFRIELIFKWVIMRRFEFFLRISYNTSIFSVSSEEVSFTRIMADWSDFSVFSKLVNHQKFNWESKTEPLWKLPVTSQVVANFLILLIKLIASLPKPLGFKCNVSLLDSKGRVA